MNLTSRPARTTVAAWCLLIGLFAAVLLSAPAQAGLTPADRADVQRIETYLETIKSLKARFLQIAPDGSQSTGDLYLRRPGRLRFEYDPPVPILLVADGLWLVFFDKEIEQVSRVPLSATPLGLLVQEEVNLQVGMTIDKVDRLDGHLSVTMHETAKPEQGQLTMVFESRADQLALRRWIVRDAQDEATEIVISDEQVNLKLEPRLFFFFDPSDADTDN